MKKMKKCKTARTLKTTCLFLTAILLFALCGCSGQSRTQMGAAKDNAKYNTGDAQISDKIENIVIDWTSGTIDFATHEGETVDITETVKETIEDNQRVHWRVDGKTLYIKYDDSTVKLISFNNLTKHLTVTLPKDLTLNELAVDATSAAISGPELKAKNLNIGFTSGDLDIDCTAEKLSIDATSGLITARCNAQEIEVEATSGKIDLTQTGSADSISFDVTSGDINLSAESFKNLKISATSSDVNLSLPSDLGFTADVDITSGDFETDFPVKMKNDTYTAGDGSARILIDVTSGDVNIREQ